MTRKTWPVTAAVASVVCGFLIAAAVGGAPPWAGEATIFLLVGATAMALASGAKTRRRHRKAYSPARLAISRKAMMTHDARVVSEVFKIVTPRDIDWVRNETFVVPWQGSRITPLRTLSGSANRLGLPLDAEIDATLQTTIAAVSAFVELYDVTTSPDPMLLGGEWQEVSRPQIAEDGDAALEAFDRSCEMLRASARAVARAYDQLVVRSQ